MRKYPDDADGDAMRRIEADGSDMKSPMEVDFMVDVPGQAAGEAVAREAAALGYRTSVVYDEGEGGPDNTDASSWTVYCTKTMLLTYEGVIDAQAELDRVGRPFGGRSDGWGTFASGKSSE